MTREYERALTESEKEILRKQIDETKSSIPKDFGLIILKILFLIFFAFLLWFYPKIWLIIILSIVSLFILWSLYYEISDLMRLPKFIKKKEEVIKNGIVSVNEINLDRYIKIVNFQDEGNHYIVEYNGMLTLIGGQEFLGVRKLKNKIEQIEIFDPEKTGIYYEKIKKSGKNLNPHYVFKNGISDNFAESEIWSKLTNRTSFPGKLEDLDKFIKEDK